MHTLGIFAKYWEPGRVKTRLARAIGAESAASLHREFVGTLVRRLSAIAARRVIGFSPPERVAEFSELAGADWDLWAQPGVDLGGRMNAFFADAFKHGANRVVLIGSDSPNLPVDFIEQAFEHLKTTSVVLGPSLDGGYYLVGSSDRVPPIFADVAWSTGAVLEQTVDLLRQHACPYAMLPEWYDVDELPDLQRLQRELVNATELDPALDQLRHTVSPL